MKRLIASIILLPLLFAIHLAAAQTIAPPSLMSCVAPASAVSKLTTGGACNGNGYGRQYVPATTGAIILACNPAVDTACLPGTTKPQPNWSTDNNYHWFSWPVPATYGVLVCNKTVSSAVFTPSTTDPCTAGEDDVNKPLVFASTLLPVTPPITTPTTYTITLTWTAPVVDIYGNLLTTIKGYNIYQGPTQATRVKVATVPATQLTWSVSGVSTSQQFGVTAVTAAGEGLLPTTTEGIASAVPNLGLQFTAP